MSCFGVWWVDHFLFEIESQFLDSSFWTFVWCILLRTRINWWWKSNECWNKRFTGVDLGSVVVENVGVLLEFLFGLVVF